MLSSCIIWSTFNRELTASWRIRLLPPTAKQVCAYNVLLSGVHTAAQTLTSAACTWCPQVSLSQYRKILPGREIWSCRTGIRRWSEYCLKSSKSSNLVVSSKCVSLQPQFTQFTFVVPPQIRVLCTVNTPGKKELLEQ